MDLVQALVRAWGLFIKSSKRLAKFSKLIKTAFLSHCHRHHYPCHLQLSVGSLAVCHLWGIYPPKPKPLKPFLRELQTCLCRHTKHTLLFPSLSLKTRITFCSTFQQQVKPHSKTLVRLRQIGFLWHHHGFKRFRAAPGGPLLRRDVN